MKRDHAPIRPALRLLRALALLSAAFFACHAGQNAASAQEAPGGEKIVVGEYASFTGALAAFGHDTDKGVQMAVDEANAAGGVEFGGVTRLIELVKQDDQSTSQGVAEALNRLFAKNPVVALGEVASGFSKVGGALCQAKGIPMITPCSTNLSVTQMGDYVFRACFIDSYQAAALARFAADGLQVYQIAVLTNRDSDYSKLMSQDFIAAYKKRGGTIVMQRYYGNADTDYRSLLREIKAKRPEAVFVPGYYQDAGSICRQARQLGIAIPILGGDGWASKELFRFGGDGLKNTYFCDHFAPDDKAAPARAFVEAYRAKYAGEEPSELAALGYDAAKLAFDAMKRAKAATPAALRDAIADTRNFAGATGSITIDKDRNAAKTAVILTPKNGRFTLYDKIESRDKPM